MVVNNNKGQTLLESVLSLTLMIGFFIFIINKTHFIYYKFLIEDAAEKRLICEFTTEPACQAKLTAFLSKIKFRTSNIRFNKNENNYSIKIEGEMGSPLVVERELNATQFTETF